MSGLNKIRNTLNLSIIESYLESDHAMKPLFATLCWVQTVWLLALSQQTEPETITILIIYTVL